jgi:phosphoribosylglycinamide formyltransferase-1
MVSILENIKKGRIRNVCPRIVISNKTDAPGLKKAEDYGVPAITVTTNKDNLESEISLIKILRKNGVTPENGLVCLAGYMKILSKEFVRLYGRRILNIHPSLLPAFPGLNAQKQAIEYGVKLSGCTVHFVDEGVDSGPIIAQAAVTIRDNESVESLSDRILHQEHILYPKCVELFCDGRIKICNRVVEIIQ